VCADCSCYRRPQCWQASQWGIIAARAAFDGMMINPNVVDVAVQLPGAADLLRPS
jgi:hypothetical protein